MPEKVIVALSGGVDSAVSAALLKEQGYEVEGIFMKNWSPTSSQSLTDCPWEQDQADAEAVCAHLGIPFRSVNFEREYREKVVDYLVREYAAGRTPNPDVMCNAEIKFAAFWEVARTLGAERIATGHYALLKEGRLYRGADPRKDQSYFLYRLTRSQLEGVMFPVGGYTKPQVRELAERFGLPNQAKKDSQGICFIGHLDLKEFLAGEIGRKPGPIYLLPPYEEGSSLKDRQRYARLTGEHIGVAYHTIGERMGKYLDNRLYHVIRGDAHVKTTFVVSKEVAHNRVFVTDDSQDPHLFTTTFQVEEVFETGGKGLISSIDTSKKNVTCQVRYQQHPVAVERVDFDSKTANVRLLEPVAAVSEGQSAVFYEGDCVIGGGVICHTA